MRPSCSGLVRDAAGLYLSISAAYSGCYHTKAACPNAWSCHGRPQPRKACHQLTSVRLAFTIINNSDIFGGLLTAEYAATLIHTFATSRVYCNIVLARAPKVVTNKLQHVMNAAARILTGTRKFDRGLTQLMHDNLHWLDVPESVKYKVIILTHRCLIGTEPRYLAADCVPVSKMAQRRHLRSAAGHQLVAALVIVVAELVAFAHFSVLGPRPWNCPNCCMTVATTLLALETFFLTEYQCIQHIRGFGDCVLYKSTFY